MPAASETTRRTFLCLLSSLGVVLSGSKLALAQGTLPTRPIPRTSETLPVIGLGSTKGVLQILDDGPGPLTSVFFSREIARTGC